MALLNIMNGNGKSNVFLFWVPALLLLAPTVYVIFLLESTVNSESLALKNKLREIYKVPLIDVSKKLSEYWKLLENDEALKSSDPIEIHSAIGADSLILYDTNGKMIFPIIKDLDNAELPPSLEKVYRKVKAKDTINAINSYIYISKNSQDIQEITVAMYEAASLLKKIGKPEEALEICNRLVFDEKYRSVFHYNGDSLYLNSILLLLELEPNEMKSTAKYLEELVTAINNYQRTDISSEQRLNLSKRLNTIRPELYFPLQKSESIALELLSRINNPDRRNILLKTLLEDIWQYTANGRIVILVSKQNLEQKMLSLIQSADEIPEKTMIRLNPPGQLANDPIVHIDAANRMPGWRISLNFIDPGYMASLIKERAKVYRITSVLIISFTLVLGFLFMRDMRRKLHLADLKNDLVANVTHELKTPLASSRLLLDTLINQPDLPKEKLESYLNHLSKENTRLCRLVEHFLAFSKLEKDQYNFQIVPISLDDLIDDLNEAIQGRFPTTKQRIDYKCTEEEIFLKGDIQSLVTVIVNLLENALKFSDSDQKVQLEIVPKGENLRITVTDHGIGISGNDQKKVFEQYYQADNKLSRKYEGSGLGLSIVKTVLKAHGSDISIISEPGKGSSFSFELKIENEDKNETVHTHS